MITKLENPYKPEEIKNILHPLVSQWFFSKFKEFSLPQLYGVMEIHQRKNVLISAPTGATKTLTGFLSILNELIDSAEKGILEDKVYAVYISPLKALNNDIAKNLIEPLQEIAEIAGKKLGIRVAVRTGDTTPKEKAAMLKNPPHILITTPESLAILLTSIKFVNSLKDVQWCIIDEIHALAENKRGTYLSLSLERLQRLSPSMCRIGLSATIAPLEEVTKFLVGYEGKKLRNCGIVDVQFLKKMDLKVISPVKDLVNADYMLKHKAMHDLIHDLVQDHKTTLIFTNTRSGTERMVHNLKELFPKFYGNNIAAHHGSLSKELRFETEENLRKGKMKVIVSSTSLELGIDIGYIDLVLCLGSPKSVARFVQRAGRAGHKLHDRVKARMIVMNRDDLIECSLLLKAAVEKKIDKINIPRNALDVLSQQIYGILIQDKFQINELFGLIKQSYCFHELEWKDFEEVIKYLSGEYVSLEDRYIFAKIWHDKETGMLGKRGRLARVIYMTNIGTIPDESFILVKAGEQVVGKIDEGFLEKLKSRDIFVLGGEVYEFKFSRGMTIQVNTSPSRPPNVPNWFSEMLPLSFDLAMEISKFRRLIGGKFKAKKGKKEIISFIKDYLYVDKNAAEGIYSYCYDQFRFIGMPSDKKIIVEHFKEENREYIIFHTLFGRRVNDCLSRAMAFAIGRLQHRDVEIGITDNGFYLGTSKNISVMKALKALEPKRLRKILEEAIEKSEILKRRFRHCAARSLMILRQYKGRRKGVGRQQISSKILMCAVRRISEDFPILKEARREVLEDLMDFEKTKLILERIGDGGIEIEEVYTTLPSPFAFNLVVEGYSDMIKLEDKQEFLKRMHQMIKAKIALGKR
jgi:ATP-dependent Lhr-like helicase